MPRVKGGVQSAKTRRTILKMAKGYRHGRSKKEKAAYESLVHAGKQAFANRRDKKNEYRQLWIVRLNAAIRENGGKSYSTFISGLKKNGVLLDRKVLATFATEHPEVFKRISAKAS
ncbi:MAG: ribosomal protein L20 [Parcubacteria bacterium C7867-001]|nr:MAG: ribosomal protein L20 [Parcubacteria bacterium C7867-001]